MAFLIPSIQFFFGIPRALSCMTNDACSNNRLELAENFVSYRRRRRLVRAASVSFSMFVIILVNFLMVFISKMVAEDGLDLGSYQN
jgi:hypothetical protein